MSYPDRFESDKEAYLEKINDSNYSYNIDYDEAFLLTLLIENLKEAKFIYHLGYRNYLTILLNDAKGNKSRVVNYKSTIWFNVGLLFAMGEIEDLKRKFENNASKMAKFLKHPNYEKYILATLNDYKTTNKDKNIYASKSKMEKNSFPL